MERLLMMAAASAGGQAVTVTAGPASDNGVLVVVPLNEGGNFGPGGGSDDAARELALSLGFAVVRSLVEMNGGHVALESQAGGRASVRVWLPSAARTGAAGPA
jgi:two-component sensor histidine kinase